jgi:hypothetical protein
MFRLHAAIFRYRGENHLKMAAWRRLYRGENHLKMAA